MTPIAEWLGSLGLSEYADRFAENRIDLSILRDLTDQDLKDLGFVLADRWRILRAIAELAGSVSATPRLAAAPASEPRNEAERRQVTVMFADLVGSPELAACTDPEDLREIVSAFQKCVAETVDHFGGFVAQYMGDGVLLYFGYPRAQEDDAERAVRTGLALTAAVAKLKTHAPLRSRVGIATGLVVVGSGDAREHGIVGETPNLAARLLGIAEPDTLVIAEGTRRLLGNFFEFEDLGLRSLKGFPEPVRAWTVLRASSAEGRFEALHATGLTALVGREEECELLLRRWSKAKTGEGRVVLLSGEPGIGKSRLIAALLGSLSTEPHRRLRYFCSPQRASSALYPIIRQMERAVGLAHDDTPQMRLDKLDALLAKTSTSIQDAALFAEMLSLPNDGRYPALELSPQQRRERTLDALNLQIEALSRSSPVLMIFEDVHWIDPTSLEALSRAVDRIRTLRVLLIVTYRPEFNPPWIGLPHVTVRTIGRLAQRDVDAMINQVVGNKPLPVSIRRDIIERTDGIPLFVEEMTKAVLETESEDEARRTAALVPSSASAVPLSLHASLMARLDRLGLAKELAQVGAAIGRKFSHALLSAVAGKPEAELNSALDRIMQAGLLYRQGVPPHATYCFKHALVQDVAYSTLLREPRRALHARIAETLESQFAGIIENQPAACSMLANSRRQQLHARGATIFEERFPEVAERSPVVLAHHCTEGGLITRAISYWRSAGYKSVAQGAMVEAAAQLRKGLDLLARLPVGVERLRQELDFHCALSAALVASEGHGAPQVGEVYARARELAEQLRADDALIPILGGQFSWYLQQGEYAPGREIAEKLLFLADAKDDLTSRLVGHRAMGVCMHQGGAFGPGAEHFEKVLDLYDPDVHQSIATVAGFDLRAAAQRYLAFGQFIRGYADQALSSMEEMMRWSRTLGHPYVMVHALNWTGSFHLLRGDLGAALNPLKELLTLAEQRFPLWLALGQINYGLLLARSGKPDDGLALARKGFDAMIAIRSTWNQSYYRGMLAEICEYAARPGEAIDELQTALSIAGETRERWFEPELRRLTGEWLMRNSPSALADAEAQFQRAITVAREQNAKTWELRATVSLSGLWCDQGRRAEANAVLEPIYRWFTEGIELPHLRAAAALLESLNAKGQRDDLMCGEICTPCAADPSSQQEHHRVLY